MTTTSSTTTRRVRVRYEPLPGAKPWRAVILELATETVGSATVITHHPAEGELAVGRFDSQPEAITAACSALRFAEAGIPWTVTE